jgi:hypothetical protein
MAYTYHGKSTLIALPGESQRVINGNVIVIEKDYAIRKSELANVLADMAPGNKMPGTNYIIDTQPQFQIDDTGFARVRLSSLNLDFAAADEDTNTNIIQNRVDIVGSYSILGFKASFSFPIGNFRYFRSLFSPSQDPNFPNIVAPVLLNAQIIGGGSPNFETIFGPSKWIGATVDKVSILENRAFQYTVTAVCPPQFIQMSGNDVLVRYDLTSTIGSYVVDPNELFRPFQYNIPASNGFYYKLTQVTSTAVTEYKEQEDLRNQIAALEKEFAQAYQDTRSYNQRYIKISYDSRIENLRKQLNA